MENIEFKKGAVDAANCISEGWNFIKSKYWLFFAMGVVYVFIVIAAGRIPYAGDLINIVAGGALTCGIYIALLAQWRRQNVPFTLMFEGFSRIVQTTLITLISGIPGIVFGILIYSLGLLPDMTPGAENPFEIIKAFFNPTFMLLALLTFIVSFILSVLLFFTLPLIADRDLGIGEALSLSVGAATGNIGGLIALLIFEILIGIAGLLVCGVGIFFVLPVIYAANIVAYKSVFPDAAPSQFNDEPPRPDQYGGGNYGTPQ